MIFHILIIFWSNSQKKKKKINGKLFLNLNLLPNIDTILVLVSSYMLKSQKKKIKIKKNNDVRFLAKYTLSSVRQA